MSSHDSNCADILIVEDDANIRKLFRHCLKKHKYQVDDAVNGEMALKKIACRDYDVIITDMQMGHVNGLDVLAAAKNKDKHVQVLVVTGYGSIATAVQAMQDGAFEYLTKPLYPEALLIKVRNAVDRRRLALLLEEREKKIKQHHKMIEQDLALSKQVQASLVPMNVTNERIDIAVKYRPMIGLGGDFADIYEDPEGNFYLTVIDVTGHGVTAALLVNRICSELRKLVRKDMAPEDILHQLNLFFLDTFSNMAMFLTILSVKCDFAASQLHYAGSAHPAGLLWQLSGQKIHMLTSQNTIIGFEKSGPNSFVQNVVSFRRGDRLFLYTDGITEIENEQSVPLGQPRLQHFFADLNGKSAAETAENIIQKSLNYGNGEISDDILVMIADFK